MLCELILSCVNFERICIRTLLYNTKRSQDRRSNAAQKLVHGTRGRGGLWNGVWPGCGEGMFMTATKSTEISSNDEMSSVTTAKFSLRFAIIHDRQEKSEKWVGEGVRGKGVRANVKIKDFSIFKEIEIWDERGRNQFPE